MLTGRGVAETVGEVAAKPLGDHSRPLWLAAPLEAPSSSLPTTVRLGAAGLLGAHALAPSVASVRSNEEPDRDGGCFADARPIHCSAVVSGDALRWRLGCHNPRRLWLGRALHRRWGGALHRMAGRAGAGGRGGCRATTGVARRSLV